MLILLLAGVLIIGAAARIWSAIALYSARFEERRVAPSGQLVAAYFGKMSLLRDDNVYFKLSTYARYLEVLGEPSACSFKHEASQEYYRFTWLRSFDRPVIIVAELKSKGEGIVRIKVADGLGGYDLGKIVRNQSKPLEQSAAEALRIKARELEKLEPFVDESSIRDGANWVIEIYDHGSYRIVSRISPASGSVRDMGLMLIQQFSPGLEPIY